jgi:hypothetical protein
MENLRKRNIVNFINTKELCKDTNKVYRLYIHFPCKQLQKQSINEVMKCWWSTRIQRQLGGSVM